MQNATKETTKSKALPHNKITSQHQFFLPISQSPNIYSNLPLQTLTPPLPPNTLRIPQTMQRIKVLINLILLPPTRHRRRHKRRHPSLAIIALVRSSETLAAAAREIDDELRDHEAGDAAADLALEVEDGLEGGAEVFDAADEVAGVDVVLGLKVNDCALFGIV